MCTYMFIDTQALVCYMSECIEVKEQPKIASPRRLSIFFEIRFFFGGGGGTDTSEFAYTA